MYVILKKTSPCFGKVDVPDKYVTNNYVIVAGEFSPVMTENITEARKFNTPEQAQQEIQYICDRIRFHHGMNFEIIKL